MKNAFMPIWTIPMLIALAILTIGVRLSIVKTTYAITTTNKETTKLLREKEALELKLLQMRSPKRLEFLAKTRFQMRQPESDQRIHLK